MNQQDKLDILTQKVRQYEARYYNLQIEHEVAEEVDDHNAMKRLQKDMTRIKKALKFLEKKKADLEADAPPETE